MKHTIQSDNIELTPAMRLAIAENLRHARRILPDHSVVYVSLEWAAPGVYLVAIKAQVRDKLVAVTRTGARFIDAIAAAGHELTRDLISRRHRRLAALLGDPLLNPA